MEGLFGDDGRTQTTAPPPEGAVFVRVALERSIDRRPVGAGKPAPGASPKRGEAGQRGTGGEGREGGALTYWTDQPVIVGDRVEAPLGRGGKPAPGIVVEVGGAELLGGLAPGRIKPLAAVSGSRLPPRLVELARWMAHYYICPLGMVLATMMPAAVKRAVGKRTRTLITLPLPPSPSPSDETPSPPKLPPSARKAWEAISALGPGAFPLAAKDLALAVGSPSLAPINRLLRAGLLAEIQQDEIVAPAAPFLDTPPGETPVMLGPSAAPRHTLTPAQDRIVSGVSATAGAFAVHLIRGITGSGKTEVYLRVMEGVLDKGGSALVLVPEISLTPQTASRFQARFSSVGVAVLHSGLSASQRHRQWANAAAGRCRVVVGARSAVFAPLDNLGLIVVDEEHDSSYKQDQLPRYHGRDVAIKRAQIEGCPIILGSATPSLESWANTRTGAKYRLWELTERAGPGRLPRVELLDIAEERRAAAGGGRRPGLLGPTLARALMQTLDAGGQAILLLNRRGFANYICCASQACGWAMRCESCDASMVHHRLRAERPGGYVRCHHCLAEQRLPKQCPLCQGKIGVLGAGTQRVEEELARDYGFAEGQDFLRVDSDTMGSARDYFDALTRFGSGEVRVLLGTQMISKGLDYPNVRLVGVIDADTSLAIPDFRAAERTFQLISQVAGRAGRGEHPGRVIVQTMNPDMPAIRLAALHDYVSFANEELAVRVRSHLPPAARMARIVVRDADLHKAEASARAIADHILSAAAQLNLADHLTLAGPAPCPLSRIADMHRIGIELTATSRTALQSILAHVREHHPLKSDAHTAIDVDPVMLL